MAFFEVYDPRGCARARTGAFEESKGRYKTQGAWGVDGPKKNTGHRCWPKPDRKTGIRATGALYPASVGVSLPASVRERRTEDAVVARRLYWTTSVDDSIGGTIFIYGLACRRGAPSCLATFGTSAARHRLLKLVQARLSSTAPCTQGGSQQFCVLNLADEARHSFSRFQSSSSFGVGAQVRGASHTRLAR